MENVLAYITTKDKEEAEKIAELLLNNNLVACVNIGGQVQSLFNWKGKLERASEVWLLAKSEKSKEAAILDCVAKNHSYECPCVIFLPIHGGHSGYLNWISTTLNSLRS